MSQYWVWPEVGSLRVDELAAFSVCVISVYVSTNISLAQVSLIMWSNQARLPVMPLLLRVYFCVPLTTGPHVAYSLQWCFSVLCVCPNHLGIQYKSDGVDPQQSYSIRISQCWAQLELFDQFFSDYSDTHQILKITLGYILIHNLKYLFTILFPRGHLPAFQETFFVVTSEEMVPSFSAWRPGLLLNSLQCTKQPPHIK